MVAIRDSTLIIVTLNKMGCVDVPAVIEEMNHV